MYMYYTCILWEKRRRVERGRCVKLGRRSRGLLNTVAINRAYGKADDGKHIYRSRLYFPDLRHWD